VEFLLRAGARWRYGGRVSRAVSVLALLCGVAMPVLAARNPLVVVDRRAAGRGASVVLMLSNAVVPVSKGSGVDAGVVSVAFDVAAAGTRGALAAPAGAFDGTSGWVAVTDGHARYRNRSTSAAVRSTLVREGARIRLAGGNPGDALLDALATGSPSGPVFVSYRVANGAQTIALCVTYRSCTYRPLNGGGFRFGCDDPEADPRCRGVPNVCGNAVREPGESCEGGAYCTASCTFPNLSPGCCQAEMSCHPADGYAHYFYLMQACGGFNGDTPVQGGICTSGTCEQRAFDTVPLCCQLAGSCSDGTASSTSGLWSYRNICYGAQGGEVVPAATCGPTGVCEPG
jgi:hypothetical protein